MRVNCTPIEYLNMNEQRLTPLGAIPKIKQYCSYQERCHSEVRDKLYAFGLHKTDVEQLISQMIVENYLNEERFATMFAGGRFRLKKWGRVKIRYELKSKKVSDYCIRKALEQIDDDDYMKILNETAMKKWQLLKGEKNVYTKKKKLRDYLISKGFESDLIKEEINKL